MATKKKSRKPKKPSAGERLTAVENAFVSALGGFTQIKQMLGTNAILQLVDRVEQLEMLFKPDLERLLGELRAVRYLLDTKKEYSFMDKPRAELTPPPFAEGPVAPSIAEGPRR
jgi:hypothetical protein